MAVVLYLPIWEMFLVSLVWLYLPIWEMFLVSLVSLYSVSEFSVQELPSLKRAEEERGGFDSKIKIFTVYCREIKKIIILIGCCINHYIFFKVEKLKKVKLIDCLYKYSIYLDRLFLKILIP